MALTIGVKNNLSDTIIISDLGTSVVGLATQDFTGTIPLDTLRDSLSLLELIENNSALIYDGASVLSKADSLIFMNGGPIGAAKQAIVQIAELAVDNVSPAIIGSGSVTVTSGTNNVTIWAPTVYGVTYFYAVSESQSVTSSTSFQQKLRLTANITVAGNYKLEWNYHWALSSVSYNFEARIQLEDSSTIYSHLQEPQDAASTQRNPVSGLYILNLTNGCHSFDLDYRSASSGPSAYIGAARLFLQYLA